MSRIRIQTLASGRLPYVLAEPDAAAAADERWPVLCFLHGYDEGPPTELLDGVSRHGPLRPGTPDVVRRFLIVAPQLPARGDFWPDRAEDVAEMMNRVHELHGGDPARSYLTGFSFGGNGVFDLALKQRHLWAALWPVDPTRGPATDPQLPIWVSSGQVSRRLKSVFVERLGVAPPQDGIDSDRIYTDDGLDHVGTAAAAYGSARIYEWLLARCRA